jgi:predicted lipoprotein with Yx(FWY)xxD motif
MHTIRQRITRRGAGAFAVMAGLALLGAACSSGGSTAATNTSASTPPLGVAPSSSPSTSSDPGAMLSTAQVANLGDVVVDGRGRTVYILTADGKTSAPCTDDSGCTKVWPDLALPDGVSAPTPGMGVQASMLGGKQENGETYATYNNWLLYEFAGDTASGQGNGEGIHSFGGTWYALSPAGNLVMAAGAANAGASSSSSSSAGSGGAYNYPN